MSVIAQPESTYALRHWDPGQGRPHVVTGVGELDLQAAPELRQLLSRLTALGIRNFVLDLTAATFVDSTILGVLNGHSRRLRSERGSLVVAGSSRAVRRTIEIAGLDRAFEMRATLADALTGAKR